jgi:hypothetical protein
MEWVDLVRIVKGAGSCERDVELSGSNKCKEFLD